MILPALRFRARSDRVCVGFCLMVMCRTKISTFESNVESTAKHFKTINIILCLRIILLILIHLNMFKRSWQEQHAESAEPPVLARSGGQDNPQEERPAKQPNLSEVIAGYGPFGWKRFKNLPDSFCALFIAVLGSQIRCHWMSLVCIFWSTSRFLFGLILHRSRSSIQAKSTWEHPRAPCECL